MLVQLGLRESQPLNKAVATVSRLLEPPDRECVCGDLKELQLSAPAAVANILGLVLRRQLAEWRSPRTIVAMFGVAGLAGSHLSGAIAQVQTGLFLQIRTYLTYGVAYEPGGVSLAEQTAFTATSTIAILLWSWACGFVLATLSRRVLWFTSFVFYSVVRVSWVIRMGLAGNIILKHGLWTTILFQLLPLDPFVIPFLLALALGVRSAKKGTLKQGRSLLLTVAGLTFVSVLAWMNTWFAAGLAHWSAKPYVPTPFIYRVLPLLATAWPLFLIPLLNGKWEKAALTERL